MSKPENACCICLETTQQRGGVPLFSPGCCGKWFHQPCIELLIARGDNKCPACRVEFNIPAAVATLPQIQQQQPPAHQPQRRSFTNMFGLLSSSNAATVNLQQAPVRHDVFSGSRISRGSGDMQEELIDASSAEVHVEDKKTTPTEPAQPPRVTAITSPEYPATGLLSSAAFHVRVGLKYEDNVENACAKVPLDLVCILDNSGSMQGSKLESLKDAMKFVIGCLGPKDRLSIVYFNSSAGGVHGLLKMTPENKEVSRARLSAISAGGGTDILDGMRYGWNVLEQRQTRNPASCVFLLTDGQDRGQLEQKQELARTVKASGTSLFVFGFGADHDSEHMTAIAQAAESPFTYIESDDMVVDAFGGSIGTQQGVALRNISLTVSGLAEGVVVAQTMSGSYANTVSTDGRSSTVRFANMYEGESREVIVRLELPTVGQPVVEYPLVRVTATYTLQSSASASAEVFEAAESVCMVQRVTDSSLDPGMTRDVNVDVQLNRLKSTAAITEALRAADRDNFDAAKEILTAALTQIRESVSYRREHPVSLGLLSDLEDALSRVQSRSEYSRMGGRAMMSETAYKNDLQRGVYTKKGRADMYQSSGSRTMQSAACKSKGGFF